MSKIIIDVREPHEFSQSHVMGAVNLPVNDINKERVESMDISKDDQIIVYCRSGNRSNLALSKLNSLGYQDVTNGINQGEVESKLFYT